MLRLFQTGLTNSMNHFVAQAKNLASPQKMIAASIPTSDHSAMRIEDTGLDPNPVTTQFTQSPSTPPINTSQPTIQQTQFSPTPQSAFKNLRQKYEAHFTPDTRAFIESHFIEGTTIVTTIGIAQVLFPHTSGPLIFGAGLLGNAISLVIPILRNNPGMKLISQRFLGTFLYLKAVDAVIHDIFFNILNAVGQHPSIAQLAKYQMWAVGSLAFLFSIIPATILMDRLEKNEKFIQLKEKTANFISEKLGTEIETD